MFYEFLKLCNPILSLIYSLLNKKDGHIYQCFDNGNVNILIFPHKESNRRANKEIVFFFIKAYTFA